MIKQLLILFSVISALLTSPPNSANTDPAPTEANIPVHYQADYQRAKTLKENGEFAAAFRLLEQLAEKDVVPAQYELGKLYLYGEGVEKNQRKAFLWVSGAALYGYAEAQNMLGLLYDEGWGIREDNMRAAHWYFQAANQGHTAAQVNIGTLFCLGEGARKDLVQCAHWMKLAKDKGNKDAQQAWEGYGLEQYYQKQANNE